MLTIIGDELLVIQCHGLISAFTAGRIVSGQDSFECLSELRVEDGVDDRVERRIGVAQPREDLEGDVRYAGLAECCHDVYAEEGHPAYQEDAHYYT